jgi:hypothetical protein
MAPRAGAPNGTPRQGRGTDLLSHVRADLVGCELVRRSAGTAVVSPPNGPSFTVEVRRERRRLIDLHVLAVHVDGPPTARRDAAIVFHHRGQLRRTGLAGRVRADDAPAVTALRDALMAGDELERAVLPLDFTSFEVRPHEGAWRATLELMGASYVRTTFPPSARYIRLDEQQFAALVATVSVLHARLPGREPTRSTYTPMASPAHLPASPAHLPASPARLPASPAHLPASPAHLPWSSE